MYTYMYKLATHTLTSYPGIPWALRTPRYEATHTCNVIILQYKEYHCEYVQLLNTTQVTDMCMHENVHLYMYIQYIYRVAVLE